MARLDTTPKGRSDLVFRQLDDEWVLYDSESGTLHVLNGTAAVVWLLCSGDRTVREIVGEIRGVFKSAAEHHGLEREIREAVEDLTDKGLVE